MDRLVGVLAGGIMISDLLVPGAVTGMFLYLALQVELSAIISLPSDMYDQFVHVVNPLKR